MILPNIVNRGLVNTKLVRILLREKIRNENSKQAPLPEIMLETHFFHNERKYYLLFYVVYIIKYARNTLFQKNNYFQYPQLVLHAGFILEAGTCTAKYIKQLHRMSKGRLISNVKMARNIAFTNNMSK